MCTQLRLVSAALSMMLLSIPALAQVTLTPIDKNFSARDIRDLAVNVADADVTVHTSDIAAVNVRITVKGNDRDKAMEYYEEQNFSVSLADATLRVSSEREKSYGTSSNWHNPASIYVTIRMPSDVFASIRTSDGDLEIGKLTEGAAIKTSDGDIAVQEIFGETITIQTSDGDIDAGRLDGSSVSVKTSDGDVTLKTLAGDSMRIQTSDGDIQINSVTGKVDAKTSDGDLVIGEMISSGAEVRTSDGEITIGKMTGSLTLRTGDGDVELGLIDPENINISISDGDALLTMPQNLSATLDISARDVEMDSFSDFSGTLDNSKVKGDLNGGGSLIRVRTSDGDVVMRSMED